MTSSGSRRARFRSLRACYRAKVFSGVSLIHRGPSPRKQNLTLIGTANDRISELIADETGHRRFIALPFRNGNAATGGNPAVWTVVDEIDFDLLWRSVEAFAPSPLDPHLAALAQLQEAVREPGPVEAWLRAFDPDAKAVAAIATNHGLKAKRLYQLFREQTESDLSLTKFGLEMARHAANPDLPFMPKVSRETGTFYPLKKDWTRRVSSR